MEPPSKRPRLSIPDSDPALLVDHDDDETNPVDLEAARARNDQRLKSIFESIFEKYEKDFTEVGDEIDLQSGRIIVNNGHLQRMEGEDDTGEKDAEWLAGLATPVVDHREEESGSETETGGDGYEEGDAAVAVAASGGSQLWSGSRRSLPADGALEGIRDDEPAGATDADADAGEYTDAYSDGNYDEDENDDTSSVDSLLDAATSVHHADNNRPAKVTARTHTTTIPITEKAIPGSEAAGALSRIRDADYHSHFNSTSDEQEPVDSKWRVPEIDAKFVIPTTWSRTLPISPSSNNTKPKSNTNAVRSASPPGARSLWALPHPGRPRKTNTDVPYQKKRNTGSPNQKEGNTAIPNPKKNITGASNQKERDTDVPNPKKKDTDVPNPKKKDTDVPNPKKKDTDVPNPKKKDTDVLNQKERNKDISASAKMVPLDAPSPTNIGQPKPKPFSSPVVANNWSFAAASDGSESDDPLQEDHQPSPAPKAVLNIRGKRIGSSAPLSGSQSRCNGCKGLFPSNDDHVLHLRSVLASNLPDAQHDRTIVKKILERIDEAHARDTDSRPKSIDSPPAHESPGDPGSPGNPGIPTPTDTVTNENQPATIKPKQRKGKYAPITPSDAKILITMRHVQKKQWKEILKYIPGKRSKNLMQWNKFHWVERRMHPPQLSRPWSLDEREKLSAFVDPQGMTWPGIRAQLAGRSSAEIECEIFRLWVGDEVWNSEEGQPLESRVYYYQDQRKGDNGDLDTSDATNLEGVALADQDESNSDVDSTVGDYLEIPDSTESSVIGASLEDTHDLYNLEPNTEYSKMLHSGQKSISSEPYEAGRRIITLKYGRKR